MRESMAEISKTTVAILLVLTILVSVMGTWTILQSVAGAKTGPSAENAQANTNSKISLTVEKRPGEPDGQSKISLNVEGNR
ncbi:hypothetical protein COV21_00455 [Candidatus Woesearchaeota archaeon CG10_big_fil_rev_8_21_14_0_10_45_5]|nr:MAG: hypothetical protein COV21_00455 [Candidatus Woesearchaeota archaeon CG10_big_fil_rev_8_21_14_0_10_45_5]PIU30567.1 MAG: hypothetical protein COT07_00025 [Candidatus Woesearchaeota archaeon CG07_land_8_20_14_0_80_44_23]